MKLGPEDLSRFDINSEFFDRAHFRACTVSCVWPWYNEDSDAAQAYYVYLSNNW